VPVGASRRRRRLLATRSNTLKFYDDVQQNLIAKGKNGDALRVRVVAFRDLQG